jgi:DNA-binding beta-propeller fold protein YncE
MADLLHPMQLYIPTSNKLLISDGGDDTPNGWCRIVSGDTYEIIDSPKLAVDADPIRYNPTTEHLYIANGGKDTGNNYSLISVIDTIDGGHVGDIRVESPELEAMAVERSGKRLFVNIKTHNQIGIIDPEKQQVVSTWPIPEAGVPTPMALDEDHHRLLVACRKPPRLVEFNTETRKVVASVPCGGGADDMYYDGARKRIYITGEEGLISIVGQINPDRYELIKTLPTGRVISSGGVSRLMDALLVGAPDPVARNVSKAWLTTWVTLRPVATQDCRRRSIWPSERHTDMRLD